MKRDNNAFMGNLLWMQRYRKNFSLGKMVSLQILFQGRFGPQDKTLDLFVNSFQGTSPCWFWLPTPDITTHLCLPKIIYLYFNICFHITESVGLLTTSYMLELPRYLWDRTLHHHRCSELEFCTTVGPGNWEFSKGDGPGQFINSSWVKNA